MPLCLGNRLVLSELIGSADCYSAIVSGVFNSTPFTFSMQREVFVGRSFEFPLPFNMAYAIQHKVSRFIEHNCYLVFTQEQRTKYDIILVKIGNINVMLD